MKRRHQLETVEYPRDYGSNVIVKGTGENSDQGSEETEATLTSLHALVFQLFVKDLDDGGNLRTEENYGAVGVRERERREEEREREREREREEGRREMISHLLHHPSLSLFPPYLSDTSMASPSPVAWRC